jgi:hypothetical protein
VRTFAMAGGVVGCECISWRWRWTMQEGCGAVGDGGSRASPEVG